MPTDKINSMINEIDFMVFGFNKMRGKGTRFLPLMIKVQSSIKESKSRLVKFRDFPDSLNQRGPDLF